MQTNKSTLSDLHKACKNIEEDVEFPTEGEFFYYTGVDKFKTQLKASTSKVHNLLSKLPISNPPLPQQPFTDTDDAHAWAVSAIDDTLDKLDDSLAAARDELNGIANNSKQIKPPAAGVATGGGMKTAATATAATNNNANKASTVKGQAAMPADGFISYMTSKLKDRPQDLFHDQVDNSNTPFIHRPAINNNVTTSQQQQHPLHEQLSTLQYPAWQLQPTDPTFYRSFEDTPFTYIDTLEALQAAATRISTHQHKELAVDLEAHSHRSFQGFCCLMQLSTRNEDLIVDVIALRQYVGTVLGPIFANPAIVKVLHGSDRDVVWLQRDFGIYTCNLFDTGQAARVLGYGGHGLGFLLEKHCGFKSDKRFQLADWRLRPLSEQALHYARADTHYLLYCYDVLKKELVEFSSQGKQVATTLQVSSFPTTTSPPPSHTSPVYALLTVLERSRQLCWQLYEKERLHDDSFLDLYSKLNMNLSDEQLAVFASLYTWRDGIARKEDESTGYVLSRAQLTRVAQVMPSTTAEIVKLVGKTCPLVSNRAGEVLKEIKMGKGRVEEVAEIRRKWRDAATVNNTGGTTTATTAQQPSAATTTAAAPSREQQQQTYDANDGQSDMLLNIVTNERPQQQQQQRGGGGGGLKPKAVQPITLTAAKLINKSIGSGGGGLTATNKANTASTAAAAMFGGGSGLQPKNVKPLTLKTTTSTATTSTVATINKLGGGKASGFGQLVAATAKTTTVSGGTTGTTKGLAAVRAVNPSVFATTAGFVVSTATTAGGNNIDTEKQNTDGDAPVVVDQAAAVRDVINNLTSQQQQPQGDEQQQQVPTTELPEFMPLSLAERYDIKGGKKRNRDTGTTTNNDKRKDKKKQKNKEKTAAAAAAGQHTHLYDLDDEADKKLKRKYVELGLDDDDADDDTQPKTTETTKTKEQKNKPTATEQPPTTTDVAEKKKKPTVDLTTAKQKYDLGIINPHKHESDRGRGGRGGRGRGGRNNRGGRGGRGGRDNDVSLIPVGKFNPYVTGADISGIKGGKRSAVHMRSGNRSATFK